MSPTTSTRDLRLLDETSVIEHLRRRGVLPPGVAASAETLGGGVSNVVLRVAAPNGDMVVKQALSRLRVEREWLADPARTVTEGWALRLAAAVDPGWVPAVLDLVEEARILVIRAAPAATTDWKQRLLAGDVDISVATGLGRFIAAVHATTHFDGSPPAALRSFDADEAFAQLRVRPYFETVAEADPNVGRHLAPVIDEMRRRRCCLVHGDLSPKNVLCGGDVHWLIDWEVAHLGDPAFDLAFMCTHLLLKSVHRPSYAPAFRAAALAFLEAYRVAGGSAPDDAHARALTGALLTARVDGASPAEYLTDPERVVVRDRGHALLATPEASLSAAIEGM